MKIKITAALIAVLSIFSRKAMLLPKAATLITRSE